MEEISTVWRELDGRARPARPIDEHLEKIVAEILKNQVTIIRAETGAGKTLCVPQYLISKYPEAVQLEGYWNHDEGEVRGKFTCDLETMRGNHGFLSDFSLNMDSFDTFYNQGVQREISALQDIHEMLDQFLGVQHPEAAAVGQ